MTEPTKAAPINLGHASGIIKKETSYSTAGGEKWVRLDVVTPAPDEYTSPRTVIIHTQKRPGRVGQKCTISYYVYSWITNGKKTEAADYSQTEFDHSRLVEVD